MKSNNIVTVLELILNPDVRNVLVSLADQESDVAGLVRLTHLEESKVKRVLTRLKRFRLIQATRRVRIAYYSVDRDFVKALSKSNTSRRGKHDR